MSALTCSGFQVLFSERTRAERPATIGVAIDVPLSDRPSLPVPMPAEKTLWPTALTSGLASPALRMPRDEKLATLSSSPGIELLEVVHVRAGDVHRLRSRPARPDLIRGRLHDLDDRDDRAARDAGQKVSSSSPKITPIAPAAAPRSQTDG